MNGTVVVGEERGDTEAWASAGTCLKVNRAVSSRTRVEGAGARLLGVRVQQMLADLLTPCPARGKVVPLSFGVTHPEVKCCSEWERKEPGS